MKKLLASMLSAALLACLAVPALAAYPEKPIQLIVPYAPGGGNDVTARILVEYVNRNLPQPMVVTNVNGGVGRVGTTQALRAKADGYTLLWEHPTMAAQTATKVVDYSYRDFDMICVGVRSTFALVINKRLPVNSVGELLEYMRTHPKQVRWPMSFGAMSHFGYLYVVGGYKGSEPLEPKVVSNTGDKERLLALISDNADASPNGISSVLPYVKSGDIKALAVLSEERNPFLPDVPTMKEQGFDVTYNQIFTLFGPKGMPAEVKKTLADAFQKALAEPAVKTALAGLCCEPYFLGPEEGAKLWKIQEDKNNELVSRFKLLENK